ncbi:hypothetical protein OC846_003053 [Tilletia horrida]|uniref:Zn(2)-C6 fungal-type domain-containing protein n=1 Tax=Tilletia horrida TaxID=155126 RepID=A0AAN6GTA5_9BASI|nr:hypothetical protein OC846_003053 [Tilletia horrida]KAK0566762.1 hypothetical protein OC861_003041 [Tilletia horrida]
MQQVLQFTPAMIFAELTHYPTPPSTSSTEFSLATSDDCLSAVLSSPAMSTFDDISPHPAAPLSVASADSPASTLISSTLVDSMSSSIQSAHSSLTTSTTQGSTSPACLATSLVTLPPITNLTVDIPTAEPALFDMSQFPATPLSAGTDGSFSSFTTASPAMPLYGAHMMPPSASGCLYEAAMTQTAVATQTGFPAHLNFRASYPAASLQISDLSSQQPQQALAYFNGAAAERADISSGMYPSSGPTTYGMPSPADLIQMPSTMMSSFAPMSKPAISSFLGGPAGHMGGNQIPHPEFLNHLPRHSFSTSAYPQPHFSPIMPSLPQLPRSRNPSSDSLNLYDASGIRNSGILFAPNGRILLACSFCKLRKLRCNGGTPGCSQCAKRGLCCQYPTTIRRRGKAKRKMESDAAAAADGIQVKKEAEDDTINYDDDDDDDDEDDTESLSASSPASSSLAHKDGKGNASVSQSRAASEEPDRERSRKRKGESFGSEPLLTPAFKKRSQSCHGSATSSLLGQEMTV